MVRQGAVEWMRNPEPLSRKCGGRLLRPLREAKKGRPTTEAKFKAALAAQLSRLPTSPLLRSSSQRSGRPRFFAAGNLARNRRPNGGSSHGNVSGASAIGSALRNDTGQKIRCVHCPKNTIRGTSSFVSPQYVVERSFTHSYEAGSWGQPSLANDGRERSAQPLVGSAPFLNKS